MSPDLQRNRQVQDHNPQAIHDAQDHVRRDGQRKRNLAFIGKEEASHQFARLGRQNVVAEHADKHRLQAQAERWRPHRLQQRFPSPGIGEIDRHFEHDGECHPVPPQCSQMVRKLCPGKSLENPDQRRGRDRIAERRDQPLRDFSPLRRRFNDVHDALARRPTTSMIALWRSAAFSPRRIVSRVACRESISSPTR